MNNNSCFLKFPLSFLLFISITGSAWHCAAQDVGWIWKRGDSTFNSPGNYGTIGVTDSMNYPQARYSSAQWKDHSGNLWIYGGYGTTGYLGDMWRYNVNTNKWTWVFGDHSANLPASYGTLGVPSANNFPGCRSIGGAAWVDASGAFWLFGGKGYGSNPNTPKMLADLWRFDLQSNKWTWMKGNPDDTAFYGTLQIPDSLNSPGSRMGITANWIDSTGLWFYGGTRNNKLKNDGNDMWRYDIPTGNWEWMSGDSIANVTPDGGTKYIFSPTNTPGGRLTNCGWQDSNGKFWMFGGHNDVTGTDWADLWEYDPDINQWAWQSGSIDSTSGVVGALCDTSKSFYPKGRWENSAAWTDDCDDLWLFGGQRSVNSLNDLWVYSTQKMLRSFVSGTQITNDDGFYGSAGIANGANLPPSRLGTSAWRDNNGRLWLFGGSQTSVANMFYSDLWVYNIDPSCPSALSCGVPTGLIEHSAVMPEVIIFPNPSAGSFTISIKNADTADPLIDATDLFGRYIFLNKKNTRYTNGWWSGQFDLSAYANTVFLLYIRLGDKVFMQKLMIQ